jgi:hypothetical protein
MQSHASNPSLLTSHQRNQIKIGNTGIASYIKSKENYMSNTKQQSKETQEKIKEMLASITTIKGEEFSKIVEYMSMAAHLTKVIAVICRGQPDHVIEAVNQHVIHTLDASVCLIIEGFKISDADEDEMLNWVQKISDQVDFGLHQMMRGVK